MAAHVHLPLDSRCAAWAELKECTFAQWHLSVVEGANQQHDGVEYIMSFLIM